MAKNILIVGGAGYIGSHINKALNKIGYNTIVFDNFSTGHRDFVKWGKLIEGDLSDYDLLCRVMKENDIDCVMHFAAFAYVGESVSNPKKYYINNVQNTITLLNAMIECKVDKFIFSSSCAVFGEPKELPITEETPKAPINPYGKTKLMVENILEDYSTAYGLKYIALRYFNAAGADPDIEVGEDHTPETHLIPLVLDAAIGKRPEITVFGDDYNTPDGTCVRDYIHVNDLADAHIKAYEYLINGGESDAFNLGNGIGYSINDIIETSRKVTGKEITVKQGERRPGDPPSLYSSSAKIKRLLNWEPKFNNIDQIISTAWEWHKKMNGKN
jgi:UDP-glucose 4-epimerase